MPEIRLANGDNMKNINLGSVEIQEVRLGNVLVWRNNVGPYFASMTWDGNTLTGIPASSTDDEREDFDDFTTTNTALTTPAEYASGVRTITITVGTLGDADNIGLATPEDYIVGYRLQRPDNTYIAGDPSSSMSVSFGAGDNAPIADFGEPLPGVTSTYATSSGTFTAGSSTVGTVSIEALLRNTDSAGTEVTTSTQTFRDSGTWTLFLVDSNGSEREVTIPNIALNYPDPSYSIEGQGRNAGDTADVGGVVTMTNVASGTPTTTTITNATIGGPTNVELSANSAATGGPIASYSWTCISGCTGTATTMATRTVPVPQHASGTATPAVWQLVATAKTGPGVATPTTVTRRVAFRSGASVTAPAWTYTGQAAGTCVANTTGLSFTATATSTNADLAGYTHTSYSNSPQTVDFTCPACDVTTTFSGTASTETLDLSGASITTPASTPSRTYTGGRLVFTRCTASPGGVFVDQDATASQFVTCSATRPQLMSGTRSFDYRTDGSVACANGTTATTLCTTDFTATCTDTAGGADTQTITATGVTGTAPTTYTAPASSGGAATFGCAAGNQSMTSATVNTTWSQGGRHGTVIMRCTTDVDTDCGPGAVSVNGTSASLGTVAPGTQTLNINDSAFTIGGTGWGSCTATCSYGVVPWESATAHTFTVVVNEC